MFSCTASMKSRVSFELSASVSRPATPKSTRPIWPDRSRTRMFAGCGSAWKNPCRKIIVIHASAITYASRRRSSGDQCSWSRSASWIPVEPVEGEDTVARVAPVRARHPHVGVADEVPVELLGVPCLVLVVELQADRARELVDERDGVDELERADALADETRRLIEQLEVGLDLAGRGRPLHLHHHALAVRKGRAVHLADRGRRDRPLLEVEEGLLDPQTEVLFDDRLEPLRTGTATPRPGAPSARRPCPAGPGQAGSRGAART